MITASKSTRNINKFVDVAIPSPRDLFQRYGERDSKGVYLSSEDDHSNIVGNQSQVVIAQLVNAQNMIQSEVNKNSKSNV